MLFGTSTGSEEMNLFSSLWFVLLMDAFKEWRHIAHLFSDSNSEKFKWIRGWSRH